LNDQARWLARLAATRHVAPALRNCRLTDHSLTVCLAPSFRLEDVAGPGWIVVGDAACSYDPISSQGIHSALTDGIQAAEAIAASLNGDPNGLDHYRDNVSARFDEYVRNREYFYSLEQRWEAAPFWVGRRNGRLADFTRLRSPDLQT
jgi:flavin-dependent dehydrogenase